MQLNGLAKSWQRKKEPDFKVGCNAARKFPVNGIANAQPQQCGTYRSHNGKLSIAIGHFCRIHQRAHTHFAIAKIAEFNPAEILLSR